MSYAGGDLNEELGRRIATSCPAHDALPCLSVPRSPGFLAPRAKKSGIFRYGGFGKEPITVVGRETVARAVSSTTTTVDRTEDMVERRVRRDENQTRVNPFFGFSR